MVAITSEADAWSVLRGLISKEISADQVDLAGSSFDWATIKLHVDGERYHSSLPADFMSGLVDFRNEFRKAAGIVLTGDSRIPALGKDRKDELEIVYTVTEGTSGVTGDLTSAFNTIAKAIADKMDKRTILILGLSAILMFGGQSVVRSYLNNELEIRKLDASQAARETQNAHEEALLAQQAESSERYIAVIENLIDDKEKAELLSQASQVEPKVSRIADHAKKGRRSIIVSADDAKELTIQGVTLDSTDISDISRRTRRSSVDVVTEVRAEVLTFDAAVSGRFAVRLKDENGRILQTWVPDEGAYERIHRTLQRAQLKHFRIMVKLEGRRIGSEIREAKILKAWKPRR